MIINRGGFKHKAAAHENTDDPNAAARHTIRTPKALVEFGRMSCSSASQDFFPKKVVASIVDSITTCQ